MNSTISKPLVSICCITYNHAKYIERTLQGFINQNTNFPYEILIHDDCSTDGTIEILKCFERSYGGYTKLILEKENQFSKGVNIAFDIMLPMVRGKYVAVCEGDDWWIDNEKLQSQADFLEQNDECVLALHNGIKENCITGEKMVVNPFLHSGYLSDEESFMAFRNNPPTASFFLRVSAIQDYPQFLREAPVFDDVIRLYYHHKGKVYYSDKVMCYRMFKHEGSWNKMLDDDMELLRDYSLRILLFYENYNQYTDNKYAHFIDFVIKKINKRYKEVTGRTLLDDDSIRREKK